MAKKNIDLAVVLHDDCDYKDWLVELKERFYSHRLKASCATNGYLLDFYWKLGRDIEAKQYTNTYGSGFYKNLSQDLKNEMPGVKGFSPTNLKYMSYFYKLYAPLQANCPQLADNFKLLFLIPWDHHRRIIDKCKSNGATDNQRPFNAHLHAYVVYKKIYGMQAAVVLNLMHKGKDLLALMK